MTITRKVAIVTATAAIGLGTVVTGTSGVVSLAQSGDTTTHAALARPRPPQPIHPPGLMRSDASDQANRPDSSEIRTGSVNRDHSPIFCR